MKNAVQIHVRLVIVQVTMHPAHLFMCTMRLMQDDYGKVLGLQV